MLGAEKIEHGLIIPKFLILGTGFLKETNQVSAYSVKLKTVSTFNNLLIGTVN